MMPFIIWRDLLEFLLKLNFCPASHDRQVFPWMLVFFLVLLKMVIFQRKLPVFSWLFGQFVQVQS